MLPDSCKVQLTPCTSTWNRFLCCCAPSRWQSRTTKGSERKQAVTCTISQTWKLRPSSDRRVTRSCFLTALCSGSRWAVHPVCCLRGQSFPLLLVCRMSFRHGLKGIHAPSSCCVCITVYPMSMPTSTRNETNDNAGYCAKSPIQRQRQCIKKNS